MGLAKLATVDEMFSWKSPSAREYAGRRGAMTDSELIDLMVQEPRLIRRPILVSGNRIAIGFNESAARSLALEPS